MNRSPTPAGRSWRSMNRRHQRTSASASIGSASIGISRVKVTRSPTPMNRTVATKTPPGPMFFATPDHEAPPPRRCTGAWRPTRFARPLSVRPRCMAFARSVGQARIDLPGHGRRSPLKVQVQVPVALIRWGSTPMSCTRTAPRRAGLEVLPGLREGRPAGTGATAAAARRRRQPAARYAGLSRPPARSTPLARLTAVLPKTNGFTVVSLSMGIIWYFWIGSILALIFGYIAEGQIDALAGPARGTGLRGSGDRARLGGRRHPRRRHLRGVGQQATRSSRRSRLAMVPSSAAARSLLVLSGLATLVALVVLGRLAVFMADDARPNSRLFLRAGGRCATRACPRTSSPPVPLAKAAACTATSSTPRPTTMARVCASP